MVKGIATGRGNLPDEFSRAVRHKDVFVRSVFLADKLTACRRSEIKECRTFATVLRKACIARLFAIVPHRIADRFTEPCPEQAGACHRQQAVITHTAVICTVKKLFRFTELAVCKHDLPRTLRHKLRFILIVAGIAHIHNSRVAVFE